MAASLQAVLDDAVEAGTFRGVSAAVIVGDAGHWSGAAGTDLQEVDLTADSPIIIASIGKTVTAAQILRLVEEGAIGLDDPAADHFPPELDGYDANGATIGNLLGMRSGIADPVTYVASVDEGASIPELVEMLSEVSAPGSGFLYANMNYVLLGSIIEHLNGRSLWKVLRSDVLHHPSLDGVRYPVRDALAADGWLVECDPASLARWGYELYGGSVLSPASLRTMTDFGDHFYGLGAIDMSGATPGTSGFGEPAIGHTGIDYGVNTLLVAFPRTGEVASVQAQGGSLSSLTPMIQEMLAVVREG
jgi:D-alanyl-D-alanine carboxypeptidase